MSKLRAGVIGVGTFGAMHARIYAENDFCELVATADIRSERLNEMESAYKCKGYSDFRDMLKMENLDLVSICTSDELHVEPALSAIRSGVNVLVEKPLAINVADCDTIVNESQKYGVKLMVGHLLRFDPRYYTARQAIMNGQIGTPIHLYARRNNLKSSADRLAKHTSVAFFLGIHDIDFMNWCINSKVERVYAESVNRILTDIGTADTCMALIKYQDGTIASLEVSWVLPSSFFKRLDAQFEAVGTEGAVYIDGSGDCVEIFGAQANPVPDVMYSPEIYGNYAGILVDEISHFVDCVKDDKTPVVTGQ
ncbi:TPA: Gfo/Idh/MocA family oxidoreductase, partial [bacterium]|nr:Gfo/Idh/MocA family oxidoreductase [bacterium]